MNPDQPSREQIETRITALLLGELPADEAALLRYTISQDPALKKLHDQIESTLPLVREAARQPGEAPMEKPAPMKMSADRREKLLAHFKTTRPKQEQQAKEPLPKDPLFWLKRIKAPTLIEVLVMVAIVAMLAAMLLPSLSKAKMRAQHATTLSMARKEEIEARLQEMENTPAARPAPQAQLPAAAASGEPEGFTTSPGAVTTTPPTPIALPAEQPEAGQLANDHGTHVAGTIALGTQSAGGVMSADEIAGHVMAPKNSTVYSQNVVGYQNFDRNSPLSARTQIQLPNDAAPASAGNGIHYTYGLTYGMLPAEASAPPPPPVAAKPEGDVASLSFSAGKFNEEPESSFASAVRRLQAATKNTPPPAPTGEFSLYSAAPQNSPQVVTVAPEPPLAPPPPATPSTQIVLPQTEPELNTGPAVATSDTDKLAVQTADSEAVLRQADAVTERAKQSLNKGRNPDQEIVNGVALNYATSAGGIGGGGGGGGFGGGVMGGSSGVDRNGVTGLPPTQNSPQAAPAQTLSVPTTTTFALDDSGLDGPRGQNSTYRPLVTTPATANPIGAFPGVATPPAASEAASESTKSESPERRFESAVTPRGTGTVAGNRFYRNPTSESDDKKVPMVGDIPVMGRLFQSSTPASTPAPAQPAAQNNADNFGLGPIYYKTAQEPHVIEQGLAARSTQNSALQQRVVTQQEIANSTVGFGSQSAREQQKLPGVALTDSDDKNLDENHQLIDAGRKREIADNLGPATANPGPPSLGADNPSTTVAGKPAIAEPEWAGVLDHPNTAQAPNNHFISRYPAQIAGFSGRLMESTNYANPNVFNPGVSAITPDTLASSAAAQKDEELIAPGEVNFQGMDVSEALDIYAKLTDRTVLRGALPQSQIILNTQTPLTKSESIYALQAVLALNGISLVNVGDKFVKVLPSDQAGTAGGEIDRSGSTNVAALSSYVTRVVQLKYVKPKDMVSVIQPFAGLANSILPMDTNGILILRDKPENVDRMLKVIDQVDASVPAEYISEVIPIRYAKVDDVASTLQNLQSAGQTKIIPNENSGSLLVYATRDDLEKIKGAIVKLDTNQTDQPLRKPASDTPVPQPEILTSSNAFSTFAMNVSDVSFKFAEASLQNGKLPDTASIRSEEFVNAFDYRDPEAAAGQPMAFTSEQALYPFTHNRELLRFSVKAAAAGRQEGRPLNLVLLLDTSGSMERADRVEIVREALHVLSTQLHENDVVSVVSFARTARLWADGVPGDKAGATLDQVGGITPEGGTNLEEAMRLAYETARRHYLANGMNRVVLLTDGAANLGNVDPAALESKVETQRKQGIALDCFGIGWEDLNDDLLEELSSHGDGRYAFLNSPEDATKDFAAKLAGALQVAAQDLKVQVEFNPQRVTTYRQIGYAKHQLTKEQFRDNTVAAGEIASQEAGNALYTIQVNPDGEGPIATVHVRYRLPGTQDYHEHSWDVEYTGHTPALDQSSPAMRLAATASAFSEWLAASPFAQEVTPDALLNYLSGVPEVYGADDRPKQLETMIREAKSLEGK